MKLVKQLVSLEVNKTKWENFSNKPRHSVLLPNTIRCIICGPSSCGKTNIMLSLILHENGLKFKNLYIYSKTTFQPKYRFLKEVLSKIPEVNLFMFTNDEDVIAPETASNNSAIIFDDVTCENQVNIRNYFCMGRHKQIDCFYLSQTYSRIPKQLIRDNANFLIIFKQDPINLKHIYDEHVNSDLTWINFKSICSYIWKDKFACLIINKECELNNGRYRKLFDEFIKFD